LYTHSLTNSIIYQWVPDYSLEVYLMISTSLQSVSFILKKKKKSFQSISFKRLILMFLRFLGLFHIRLYLNLILVYLFPTFPSRQLLHSLKFPIKTSSTSTSSLSEFLFFSWPLILSHYIHSYSGSWLFCVFDSHCFLSFCVLKTAV
jgi:hypothetical protein